LLIAGRCERLSSPSKSGVGGSPPCNPYLSRSQIPSLSPLPPSPASLAESLIPCLPLFESLPPTSPPLSYGVRGPVFPAVRRSAPSLSFEKAGYVGGFFLPTSFSLSAPLHPLLPHPPLPFPPLPSLPLFLPRYDFTPPIRPLSIANLPFFPAINVHLSISAFFLPVVAWPEFSRLASSFIEGCSPVTKKLEVKIPATDRFSSDQEMVWLFLRSFFFFIAHESSSVFVP